MNIVLAIASQLPPISLCPLELCASVLCVSSLVSDTVDDPYPVSMGIVMCHV